MFIFNFHFQIIIFQFASLEYPLSERTPLSFYAVPRRRVELDLRRGYEWPRALPADWPRGVWLPKQRWRWPRHRDTQGRSSLPPTTRWAARVKGRVYTSYSARWGGLLRHTGLGLGCRAGAEPAGVTLGDGCLFL